MKLAFKSYSHYCWGKDEYLPLDNSCYEWLNQGATIIDSISTLYLMNLTEEYNQAKEFVKKKNII